MPPNKYVDYYETLQVSPSAEPEVIEAAYKTLAQKYHPDKNKSPTAAERMKAINIAHDILSKSMRRKQFHKQWQQRKEDTTTPVNSDAAPRPKPSVNPSHIRFSDMEPGQIKRSSFVIDNTGGAYSSISVSNPQTWLRVVTWISIISKGKLPLEIELEARGLDWGKTSTEYIKFKLDSEEAIVTVELQMKPKPDRIDTRTKQPKRDNKFRRRAIYTSMASVAGLFITIFLINLFFGFLSGNTNIVTPIQAMKERAPLIISSSAEDHLIKGNSYKKQKQWDEAIGEYTRAIELNSKEDMAYYSRGDAYVQKGDYDNAISDFTKAIEINPQYAWSYCNRGNAFANKGDYNNAISDYTRAIEINPKFTMAYHYRGITYSWKGDYNNAISDYTRIIELDPKDDMAYYYRGITYASKGEHDKAISDFTRAIELNLKNATAYQYRGDAYANKGNYYQAKVDWNKATSLGYKQTP